jgi:hypothetical protein
MEDIKFMQKEHLTILNDLYNHQNGCKEMVELVEDCLEILTELTQLELCFYTDGKIEIDDLREVYESSIDFKRFLNDFIKKYKLC